MVVFGHTVAIQRNDTLAPTEQGIARTWDKPSPFWQSWSALVNISFCLSLSVSFLHLSIPHNQSRKLYPAGQKYPGVAVLVHRKRLCRAHSFPSRNALHARHI